MRKGLRNIVVVMAMHICAVSLCVAGRLQNDREVAACAWNCLHNDKEGQVVAREAGLILDSLPRVKYRLDDSVPSNTPDDLRPGCIFVEAATWPDRIANKDDPDHDEDRPTWHRIGIPLNLNGFQGPEPKRKFELNGKRLMDFAVDKKSTLNLLQALELNEAILRDPSTPRERRAIALCWLLNLMAEIQLPPNTSSLFSKDFPNGDDCGTLYMVSDHGKTQDWHSLWDSLGNPETSSLETLRNHLMPPGGRPFHPHLGDDQSYEAFALHTHNYDRNIRQGGFPDGVSEASMKETPKRLPRKLEDGFFKGATANMKNDWDAGGSHLAFKLRKILGVR